MKRLLLLAIALVCLMPATTNASLGTTTVGSGVTSPGPSGSAGEAQDYQTTAATTETVNRLSVYLKSGNAGRPELGLYNSALSKLASCRVATSATGWNRCSIPNTQIVSGQVYWRAILAPAGGGQVNYAATSSGTSRPESHTGLATLPATWTNASQTWTEGASIYADNAAPPPPPPADTTPPDTTITSQPSDPTTSSTASFSFTGTDNVGVTGYECQLDGGGYSACTSPKSYSSLAVATHTFNVRAKDAAGNVDPTPAVYSWTVQSGSGGGVEPPPIAGQGYTKVFGDEFDTLDRTKWDDHIFYDESPHAAWTNFQTVENGILHLRTSNTFAPAGGGEWPMNTVTTQSSGRTFKYGYFEARMKWTARRGAWPGFWLYSYRHATNPAWPSVNPVCAQNGEPNSHCVGGELDMFEGQGVEPTVYYGTVHSNTAGAYTNIVADDQNGNNAQDVGIDLSAGFHTYGMKWTNGSVSWYLDDQLLMTSDSYYESLNQPMFMLLQMWNGGWGTNDPATSPADTGTMETQVDSVHVWQQ